MTNQSRFVNREMFMRFRGGGVGHQTIREHCDQFLDDKHPVDEIIQQGGNSDDENETILHAEQIEHEDGVENDEENGSREEPSENGEVIDNSDGAKDIGDEEDAFNYSSL